MRTIIDFPEEQIRALDEAARKEGVSRAEMVRRCVQAKIPLRKKGRFSELRRHPAVGTWPDPKADAVEVVRKLRAEWDHRP